MRPLTRLLTAFATGMLLQSGSCWAIAPATVEVVQAPAWVDRDGRTLPLAAGMELKSGDLVRTGNGARAYLMLAEGSRVKLGEAARFSLHTRSVLPQQSFRGALDVITGAFRFTTAKLKKAVPRDMAIRVGTATIGIRGTDVWGRTDKDGDLVALLEGKIEITRAGQVTEMTQAMTYYDAPRGQDAAVKALDPETFVRLARQTDIVAGDGAATTRGKWTLLAGSAASQETALEIYDQARDAGFAARIRPHAIEGGSWRYEVVVGRYPNAAEAEVAAAHLKAATELTPTVVR
ncbi:MAG: FecR domain-containing protein [Rhodocyclales bacterium]|nr:FecR domain-containing protein [Rhodocyclales bacterium]